MGGDRPRISGGPNITAIAVAPGNSDIVLVGYANGKIYKSTNATATSPTWAEAGAGTARTRRCTRLAIDPNNNQRYYATFSGFQSGNIWTTADGGTTWTDISAGLPTAPIHSVTIHPQNSDWIYVGTESGVMSSEDQGSAWTPTNSGPTNCLVYELFWLGTILCCATHGRGMFSIDLKIEQNASLTLAGDLSGTLSAFNGTSGSSVSSYQEPAGQIAAQPCVDGVEVYASYVKPFQVARFASAHNLSAGPTWTATLGGASYASPVLVKGMYPGDADLLYVTASDGKLYVLNAANGTVAWQLQVVPTSTVRSGVNVYSNLMMNDWIYIATEMGLFAVNTETRAVAWSKPYVCKAAPLIANDTVYAGAQDGNLYAVGARTGTVEWSYFTNNAIASTPVWVLGTVLFGNQSGDLYGLNYKTGSLQVSESISGAQIQAIAAKGNDIFLVANAPSGALKCYTLAMSGTGRILTEVWTSPVTLGASRAPQIVGDTLYLTDLGGKLSAFDAMTGSTTWQATLPKLALAAPALVFD